LRQRVSIARSVGSGFLPLRYRYIADWIGALWTDARNVYDDAIDVVYDGRVGLLFDFDRFNIQVSWVGLSDASLGYGLTGVRSRNGPVVSVSWLF